MAFPVTAVLFDDFDRANGTVHVGAPQWSAGAINGAVQELEVLGTALGTNAGGHNGRSATDLGPDFEIYFEVPVLPTNGNYIFIAARIQEPGTGNWDGYGMLYLRESGTDLWQLRRYDNGSSNVLGASFFKDLEVGDSIGFSGDANVFTALRKPKGGAWEALASREDSTYANAGPFGFEFGDSTGRADNLFAGTIGEEAPPEEHSGSVHLSGGGSITVEGHSTRLGAVAIQGGGEIAVEAHKTAQEAVSISGGGSATFEGRKDASGAPHVSGGGAIQVSGMKEARATIEIEGGSSISAAGTKTALRRCAISGGGHFTISSSTERMASVTLSGGGSITVVGHAGGVGPFPGTATASVSSAGSAARVESAPGATVSVETVGSAKTSEEP